MAFRNSLLTEDQLLCPICLGVFIRPVSTPCGHNFCMSCITSYWSCTWFSTCPVCKTAFDRTPHLKVNTFISELTSNFLSLHGSGDPTSGRGGLGEPGRGGVVPCYMCADLQEAARSCLHCLTSFCQLHLEPHRSDAALQTHALVAPLTHLQDRVCRTHSSLLTRFCKTDGSLLCDVCAGSHQDHDVVSTQRAHADMRVQLEDVWGRAQQMIQKRLQMVGAVRASLSRSMSESRDGIQKTLQDMMLKIQNTVPELMEKMERKQKAADAEAVAFISGTEAEIAALREATAKLQELRQITNQFHFLQNVQDKSTLPHTTDPSAAVLKRHMTNTVAWKTVSKSLTMLQTLLHAIGTRLTGFCSHLEDPAPPHDPGALTGTPEPPGAQL